MQQVVMQRKVRPVLFERQDLAGNEPHLRRMIGFSTYHIFCEARCDLFRYVLGMY